MKLNDRSGTIVDAAMEVHSALGAGLLEEVYKTCLRHELLKRNLRVAAEVGMPVIYDDVELELGYRLDLVVEGCVIVELKSVHELKPVHKAQFLTYLKLSKVSLGLLINFNTPNLKDGIIRLINS